VSRVLIVEDEAHLADGLASTSKLTATRSMSTATASRRSIDFSPIAPATMPSSSM
jgi:hypothetical protein